MSPTTCKITPVFGPAARTKLDLMGIRFMTDTSVSGAGGADQAAQAAAAAAKAAADKAAADAVAKPPWGDDPTKFDPDKAWKLIQDVRGDVEKERTKRDEAIAAAVKKASEDTQRATLAQFGKLLSGTEEPETDPVKLAAKVTELSTKVTEQDGTLTKAQSDLLAAQLATAIAIQAPGLGASAKLLLANKEFTTSIASVEPTDEAAITAKITAAIQANAALKATPSNSGGSEHQGGQTQALQAQLAAAEKANDFPLIISLKRQISRASTNS